MTFFRTSVPAIAAAFAIGATCAAASDYKEFRDWWAACDNLRNCSAYGYDTQLTGGAYLRVERGGAPGAKPKIALAVFVEEGVKFRLAFDDPALPGLPADVQTGEEINASDMRRVVLAEGNADALIASLRKAKEIVVTRIDPPGRTSETQVSKISLSGAVAAMLWIDEQQKRLDTTTALIRRGDRPESSVPPQPKPPVIVAAKGLSGAAADKKPPERDEAAIRKKAVQQCGEDDEGELEEAIALSTDTFLYPIRCPGSSGAYNFSYTFLIAKAGQPQSARSAKFRMPKIAGKQQDADSEEFLVNPDFSNVDMTMLSFNKGRGIGDCGDEERWVWDGKTFHLAETRSMPHCRGISSEDWPTLYRAEVK